MANVEEQLRHCAFETSQESIASLYRDAWSISIIGVTQGDTRSLDWEWPFAQDPALSWQGLQKAQIQRASNAFTSHGYVVVSLSRAQGVGASLFCLLARNKRFPETLRIFTIWSEFNFCGKR